MDVIIPIFVCCILPVAIVWLVMRARQNEIDKKVVELVRAQHQKALDILHDNKRKMDELAEYLYFRETITGDEFMNILNRKPVPKEIPMSSEALAETAIEEAKLEEGEDVTDVFIEHTEEGKDA